MALAPNPAVLALARIVLACGAALFTPTAALIALTIAEPHRRVRALSLVIGGLTASQILGVPLGTFVGGALGWRWGVGLGAPVALAAMLMVWRSVPRDIPFHPPGLASFIGAFRDWRLCMVLALTLIATSGQNLVGVYVAPIITDYTGVGTRPLSVVLVMFGVAGLLGTLTGGLLTDRIGATRTLTVFLVLNIAGCLLIPLMGVSPWLATLVIMLWSFGAFGFNPAQQARVMARAPAALGGAAMSLNAAALYVGIGVGASAGGGLIAWRGTPALAPTALVILVVGMAFLSFSERKLGRTGPGARS